MEGILLPHPSGTTQGHPFPTSSSTSFPPAAPCRAPQPSTLLRSIRDIRTTGQGLPAMVPCLCPQVWQTQRCWKHPTKSPAHQ